MTTMSSIGVVLGAGGVIGGAFHAGVLAALTDTTGWDPRTADLIVGTSAGANTAAALRGGLSSSDQFARATDRPLSPEGAALTAAAPGRLRVPDGPAPSSTRLPWAYLPQAPWLLGPAFLRPGPARYGVALAGLLPEGRLPTSPLGDRVRALHSDRWPDEPTWIVAYRTRDGRRVVFGRDDVDVPDLACAVEASSAVPGRFRPVRLASGRYLDGAVFSPSNAGVVAGLGFDLVVVSAPLSVAPGSPTEPDQNGRSLADRALSALSLGDRTRAWFSTLLHSEIEAIETKGTVVLSFEPSAEDLAEMYRPGTDHERAPAVADAVYRSVRTGLERRLADPTGNPAVALMASLTDQ
jgi:NTE family protein